MTIREYRRRTFASQRKKDCNCDPLFSRNHFLLYSHSSLKWYGDSLRAWRSGIESWWGRDFPRPSRLTLEPNQSPIIGSFTGVQRPERGVDHPPPPSADVKERVMLYLYSTSEPSRLTTAWRSGDRIPVGTKFSEPVQTDHGSHPASYTMGFGSLTGVKQRGCGVDHPPHLAPSLKKE